MDESLKLYIISNKYVSFLHKIDSRVLLNTNENYNFERKYLGVVLTLKDLKYFVPLASPKDNDYIVDSNGINIIRKSIVPIMRITHQEKDGTVTLLGKLKFSSMIPVIESEVNKYDIEFESDPQYKILVYKEWEFIRRNKDKIYKSACTIHKQKVNNEKGIGYLNSTVDFLLLEQKTRDFISED